MTVFQWVLSVSTVMANIAVVIGVPLSIAQLMKMRNDRLEKRTRDTRQSTIEFWNIISGEITDFANDVFLDDIDLSYDAIINDSNLHRRVRRYLSLMEQLSVGINSSMYDDMTFDRLYGYTTLELYSRLRSYIEKAVVVREQHTAEKCGDTKVNTITEDTEAQQTFFYGEFNRVVKKLKEHRKKREGENYSEASEAFPEFVTR